MHCKKSVLGFLGLPRGTPRGHQQCGVPTLMLVTLVRQKKSKQTTEGPRAGQRNWPGLSRRISYNKLQVVHWPVWGVTRASSWIILSSGPS
jgi:hypothetical protein